MNEMNHITKVSYALLKKRVPVTFQDVDLFSDEECLSLVNSKFARARRTLKSNGAKIGVVERKRGIPIKYILEKDVHERAKRALQMSEKDMITPLNNLIHTVLKRGKPVTTTDIYEEGLKIGILDKCSYPYSSSIGTRVRRYIMVLRNNGAVIDVVFRGKKAGVYTMVSDVVKNPRPRAPEAKSEKIVFKKEDEWLEMCKISIDWAKKPIGNFQGDFNCTREFV